MDNREEKIRTRRGPATYRVVKSPSRAQSEPSYKGVIHPGETAVDPPVRCPGCKGLLSVLPCRLCRVRAGERIDKGVKPGRPRRERAELVEALVNTLASNPEGDDDEDEGINPLI